MDMNDGGFATTTPDDHRAWLWVAGFLSLIYSLLGLAARCVAKWELIWWDDMVLSASYLCAFTHWALLFRSLCEGVGVHGLSTARFEDASMLYFASRVPYFLADCLAKLSILVFTRRIFNGDLYRENVFFACAYSMTISYGTLAVLLSSAGCRPGHTLRADMDAVCDANSARWATLTAMDGLTEIAILAMPIWFISKNQMGNSKKCIVIFVYAFRLLVIACSIATTSSYFDFLRNGQDNIGIAPVVVWQEVSLGFSLLSASFPCLRSFLWAFMSRGLLTQFGDTVGSASDSRSRNRSIQLRSMNKSHVSTELGGSEDNLRPAGIEYSVNVRGEPAGNPPPQDVYKVKESYDSDRMIIHQETSYRVETSQEMT